MDLTREKWHFIWFQTVEAVARGGHHQLLLGPKVIKKDTCNKPVNQYRKPFINVPVHRNWKREFNDSSRYHFKMSATRHF